MSTTTEPQNGAPEPGAVPDELVAEHDTPEARSALQKALDTFTNLVKGQWPERKPESGADDEESNPPAKTEDDPVGDKDPDGDNPEDPDTGDDNEEFEKALRELEDAGQFQEPIDATELIQQNREALEQNTVTLQKALELLEASTEREEVLANALRALGTVVSGLSSDMTVMKKAFDAQAAATGEGLVRLDKSITGIHEGTVQLAKAVVEEVGIMKAVPSPTPRGNARAVADTIIQPSLDGTPPTPVVSTERFGVTNNEFIKALPAMFESADGEDRARILAASGQDAHQRDKRVYKLACVALNKAFVDNES